MVTSAKQLGMCDAFLADGSQVNERQPGAGQPMPELPPSERDFLVFEAVVIHGSSTRQVAAEFDISQTRVMQVRRHVAEWIAKAVPDGLDLTPQERVRLAAHIAQGRVDFLYSQALGAWTSSQKPHTSVCRGRLTGETRTTRDSHGDPRYLLAAARLSERQLSLAGTARKVLTDAEESRSKFNVQGSKSEEPRVQGSEFGVQEEGGDRESGVGSREGEALVPDHRAEPRALLGKPAVAPKHGHRVADASRSPRNKAPGNAHPIRACSAEADDSSVASADMSEPIIATEDSDDVCSEIENRRRAFLAALEDDTAPVHPPFTDAGGMLLDSSEDAYAADPSQEYVVELKINGHQPGATLTTTAVAEDASLSSLKRHERRVRQRELDRLRRKAK